jgi:hypothetical protein
LRTRVSRGLTMVAVSVLSLMTAIAACAPGAPAVVRDVPVRPVASAAVEAGAPGDGAPTPDLACETHADCAGLAWSPPDAGDPDAAAVAVRLVGRCVHHACVLAQETEDVPALGFEQAKARFPDLAQHTYPQPVLAAPWLAQDAQVTLWVDRAQLWTEATPACTAYVFHRENDRLVAPRPRAEDAKATLQLSDFARLVGKGSNRVFGRELMIRPDALAYVGARANLVPGCVNTRRIWRTACEVHECSRCERIAFTETATGGRYRWPTVHVGALRVDDPSPVCPPCEPGLATDLEAARAAVSGVQALHVTSEGPVFHRTAAGCEKDLAARRRQNQP